MGLEEKTISSSGCTGGSAELVSDPNNILFSSHTYRFLMFLLLMLHNIQRGIVNHFVELLTNINEMGIIHTNLLASFDFPPM